MAVRPVDRKAYLDSLERASLTDDDVPYETIMDERLRETLQDYLSALAQALP